MKRRLAVMALAASFALTAFSAEAREFRVAPAAPPAHPANAVMYKNFMKYLPEESDGRLTATMIGPEVVNLLQMRDALESQIADVGNLLPLYFPADLPMMGAPGQLSLLGTNSHAMAAAMTEFIVECQPCQDEMKKLNFVYLGSGASDAYGFLTAKPVKTADDLNGIRLRSGGAPWTRLAEHFGAIPVHMSVFDQFEAIRTGVIDGTMTSIVDMQSFHLAEVVKYVTFAPIGMYISTSSFTVSRVTWDELSAEDRAAMARAANHANADFTNRWGSELPKISENAVRKMGIEFVEADPDLIKQIKKFKQADIKTAGEYLRSEFGIQDGPQQIQDYLKLVGKWTKIAKDVNNDPSEMTKRVYDEVWSKIDYATYGD